MHQDDREFDLEGIVPDEHRWRVSEILSFALAGLTLGAAVAFSGHYFAKHADARAVDDGQWLRLATPMPTPPDLPNLRSTSRASLRGDLADLMDPSAMPEETARPVAQRVARDGKSDRRDAHLIRLASIDERAFAMAGATAMDMGTGQSANPAGLARTDADARALRRLLVTTPPVAKIEQAWRLGREVRRRILAKRRFRQREFACLARAIYFEARSEGVRGQMAVAKVILNRVKDPRFPNTICGVVYDGAEKRNACQFSFTCDGKPDVPRQRKAWAQARRVAVKAMKGRISMPALNGVAYYHADYVKPKWAWSMRRVMRIGRHIFYRDG